MGEAIAEAEIEEDAETFVTNTDGFPVTGAPKAGEEDNDSCILYKDQFERSFSDTLSLDKKETSSSSDQNANGCSAKILAA
jgi:hypothetical protein